METESPRMGTYRDGDTPKRTLCKPHAETTTGEFTFMLGWDFAGYSRI